MKLFFHLLAFALCCGSFAASAAGDQIQIGSESDLVSFANKVNTGEYAAKDAKLTANISIAGTNLVSIGTEENPYTGSFNGNGKTINGITASLFGYIGSGGEVSSLTIAGSSKIMATSTAGSVAANNAGTISDCTSYALLGVENNVTAGGIAGINTGAITGCTFASSSTGNGIVDGLSSQTIGGIAGQNKGSITGCTMSGSMSCLGGNVGGIAGSNSGNIENCKATSSSTIYTTRDYSCVGGIVGNSSKKGKVTSCESSATVTGIGNVGGIAGYSGSPVSDCANSGAVTCRPSTDATFYIAGIVGKADGNIDNCTNSGSVTANPSGDGVSIEIRIGGIAGNLSSSRTVENCSNTGSITVSSDTNTLTDCLAGGIVGYLDGTVEKCYNTADVYAKTYEGPLGGIIGFCSSSGSIEDCWNSGTITTNLLMGGLETEYYGNAYAGGIAGYLYGTIKSCYSRGKVNKTGALLTLLGRLISMDGIVGECNGNYTEKVQYCYYEDVSDDVSGGWDKSVFSSGAITWMLNEASSEGAWKQTISASYYPNFNEKAVYYNGTIYYNKENTPEGSVDLPNSRITGLAAKSLYGVKIYSAESEKDASGYMYYTTDESGNLPLQDEWRGNHILLVRAATNTTNKGDSDPQKLFVEGTTEPTLQNGWYLISNTNELYWFAQKVNSGETGIKGRVTANITVNSSVLNSNGLSVNETYSKSEWTPIAAIQSNAFTGEFDGGGYTISGLYQRDLDSDDKAGLFGYVGSGAKIYNVKIEDSCFYGKTGAGGIAAENNGSITNCTVAAYVGADENSDVGGIAGFSNGSVSGCTASGIVGGANDIHAGGVVGENRGTLENCTGGASVAGGESSDVGGVAGWSDHAIENCTANGNSVFGGTSSSVGGVVGYAATTVADCKNTKAAVSGSGSIGGVVGYSNGKISGCENSGSVTGTGQVGGIAGRSNNEIAGCTNKASVISNPSSAGTYYIGGIAGYADNIEITGCTNSGSITCRPTENGTQYLFAGGIVGESNGSSGLTYNCINTGNVICESDADIQTNSGIGGIVGISDGKTSLCYNTGDLSSKAGFAQIGGIAADNNGTVEDCYNHGNITSNLYMWGGNDIKSCSGGVAGANDGTVKNSYSIGNISNAGSLYYYLLLSPTAIGLLQNIFVHGGAVGENEGTVNNVYYLNTCGAEGDGTSTSFSLFSSGWVTWQLNGKQSEGVWRQNITVLPKDLYPNFTGALVYNDTENSTYVNIYDKPQVEIDYVNEKLTGLEAGAAYEISRASYTADENGEISIQSSWFGTTIYISRSATSDVENGTMKESVTIGFDIPARPDAPQGYATTSFFKTGNSVIYGSITGLTEGTSYMLRQGSQIYYTTSGEFTELSSAVYYLSFPPVAGTCFESERAEVSINYGTHTHTYDDDKWEYSVLKHWHQCTDPDCPYLKGSIKDETSHTYTSDKCTVCGYEHKHVHTYLWESDDSNHWQVCSDPDCPDKESSKTAEEAHVDNHNTNSDGDIVCDVCQRVLAVKTGKPYEHPDFHTHIYDDGVYKYNSKEHWQVCNYGDDCPAPTTGETEHVAHSGGVASSYFTQMTCAVCYAKYGSVADITKPTGTITAGTDSWTELLSAETPNVFFKEKQSVTITAQDDSYNNEGYDASKHAVGVEYLVSESGAPLTETELSSETFAPYTGAISLYPGEKRVIYARITDWSGNVKYLSSGILVGDNTAPQISGARDGHRYCEAANVTVTDDYLETVTLDGISQTVANGKAAFAVPQKDAAQTITATDKAGNTTSISINVGHIPAADDGDCSTPILCSKCKKAVTAAKTHIFTNYIYNNDASLSEDGTATAACDNDGCSHTDTRTVSGTKLAATNAAAPSISVQPQGATYTTSDTPAELSVWASSSDGGLLSYQWYSNSDDSNTGGAAISGATNSSYTPSVSTAGTTYYYCVVTNTISGATGNATATAASSTAQIAVTGSASPDDSSGSSGGSAAIKAYRTVYIPAIDGITTNPAAGYHYVAGSHDFTFTISSSDDDLRSSSNDIPWKVTATGYYSGKTVELEPTDLGGGTYQYTLHKVTEPWKIAIERTDLTGTEPADDGTRIWSHGNTLHISVADETEVDIYTLSGTLIKTILIPAGETLDTLERGVYVVKAGSKIVKVVIR